MCWFFKQIFVSKSVKKIVAGFPFDRVKQIILVLENFFSQNFVFITADMRVLGVRLLTCPNKPNETKRKDQEAKRKVF